ncbi:MAG: type II toxin-antitoxin system RatA family toxin [bacterium]
MAIVEKSALVPYSAQQLYEIVDDIDAYVDFLPWCSASGVLSRDDAEVHGMIEVSKAGVKQSFVTINQLTPYQRIDIRLKEGPFRKLEGHWEFIALREDACKVALKLEFHFSNGMMDRAFGIVFEKIANTLVDAFCERAVQIHGR